MNTGFVMEPPVAKKRGRPPLPKSTPDKERIEILAEPHWLAKLDTAARAAGLSRAAYIRVAVNNQIAADRQASK